MERRTDMHISQMEKRNMLLVSSNWIYSRFLQESYYLLLCKVGWIVLHFVVQIASHSTSTEQYVLSSGFPSTTSFCVYSQIHILLKIGVNSSPFVIWIVLPRWTAKSTILKKYINRYLSVLKQISPINSCFTFPLLISVSFCLTFLEPERRV